MKWLLNLLFPVPAPCSLCERRAYEQGICRLCLEDLNPINGEICDRCGRLSAGGALCVDCSRRKETYFVCNRSALEYNRKMKEIISLYKFRGQESLGHTLAGFLENAFQKYYKDLAFDAITFVPLHETRMKERGFNQAEQLAAQLSQCTKIPLIPLLNRTRSTDKQSKKHRQERLQTLHDAFQVSLFSIPLKRILLVDDVYTTGSTVNECARVLAREEIEVYSLTVAR